MQKMKEGFIRFMQGRHGTDNLGMCTLIVGLILSLVGSFTGAGVLSILGLVLYVITVFRMFSRNHEARMKENQKYIELTSGVSTKVRQFIKRMNNRKEYKYFKCPNCKVLLRLKRGCGEKDITCVRCGHQFKEKA
jgi:membrane-bound ClpP family serine protease